MRRSSRLMRGMFVIKKYEVVRVRLAAIYEDHGIMCFRQNQRWRWGRGEGIVEGIFSRWHIFGSDFRGLCAHIHFFTTYFAHRPRAILFFDEN